MKISLSRRQFLWTASAGMLAAGLPVLAWRRWQVSEARADSRPQYFTGPDYATLQDVVDLIIPPDTDFAGNFSPGAKAAGVADYINFLLGAFLGSAPFIFAGGPFSDRNPVGGQRLTDDMAQPMVLTPLQRLAWRIRILGTIGAATNATDAARIEIVRANNKLAGVGDGNGDVQGFQQQYSFGIATLRKAAKSMFGGSKDFFDLTPAQQQTLFNAAATTVPHFTDFVALVTNHAAEGMYGNPEYGGNQPGTDNRPIGWVIANFEGDRQPLGYTTFDPVTQTIMEDQEHPVSTPDPKDTNLAYRDPKAREMMRQVAQAMSGLNRRARS